MKFFMHTLLAASISTLVHAQTPSTDYIFVNNCPEDIKFYRHNAFYADLAQGANVTRTDSLSTGYYYTDANGGGEYQVDSSTKFATYWAENDPQYLYYIVKNATAFNTGMRIEPSHSEINGFCPIVTCDSADCTTAWPRRIVYTDLPAASPTPPTTPPAPPFYSCPFEGVTYTITFCPSGEFPPSV